MLLFFWGKLRQMDNENRAGWPRGSRQSGSLSCQDCSPVLLCLLVEMRARKDQIGFVGDQTRSVRFKTTQGTS